MTIRLVLMAVTLAVFPALAFCESVQPTIPAESALLTIQNPQNLPPLVHLSLRSSKDENCMQTTMQEWDVIYDGVGPPQTGKRALSADKLKAQLGAGYHCFSACLVYIDDATTRKVSTNKVQLHWDEDTARYRAVAPSNVGFTEVKSCVE